MNSKCTYFIRKKVTKLSVLYLSLCFLFGINMQIPNKAEALTMKAYSLDEIRNQAHLIIHGRIESISYQRVQDRLMTVYKLISIRTYKTQAKSSLNSVYIVLPGGIEGQLEQVVPGIPKLTQDTDYLAFLTCKQAQPLTCQPIGYGQGLWSRKPSQSTPNYNAHSSWHSLTTKIHWIGSVPQNEGQSLKQLLGSLIKDESQSHLPPSVAQP